MKKILITLFVVILSSCSITDVTINATYVMADNGIISKDSILNIAAGISKIQKKRSTNKDLTLTEKEYKGSKYYEYKKENSDNVVILVHGGAFKLPLHQLYVKVMESVYNNSNKKYEMLLLDYKTEVKYPSQSLELEKILEYAYSKYKKVILMGDSSGGNVILSAIQKQRDENKKLPDGLILLSPWADPSNRVESRVTNFFKDVLFGNEDYPKELLRNKYLSEVKNLDNPYVSPVFGVYNNFPKTLIQVGENEVLFDDSKIIYEKMKKVNVDVKFTVYKKMFHVFQLLQFLPETKQANMEMGQFIDSIF
ncbi:alpha/beta hydrolase fold domain-containing protein [Caviibacter abscessus]|uniref:alpha/beta hydrolase fold domain-containing protein n=1 Tax=Caviibacter abscessus TaxID=1766719 RepID=UPI00082A3B79|nr:alpha/beta hydrolase [Caviibacter abscessus]